MVIIKISEELQEEFFNMAIEKGISLTPEQKMLYSRMKSAKLKQKDTEGKTASPQTTQSQLSVADMKKIKDSYLVK